jgi:hypothetical protein
VCNGRLLKAKVADFGLSRPLAFTAELGTFAHSFIFLLSQTYQTQLFVICMIIAESEL